MSSHRTPAAETPRETLPLTRCRHCSSPLLQLERVWVLADGRHVARRHCPDCDFTDNVTAGALALNVWRKLSRRRVAQMERSLSPRVAVAG